MYSDNTIKKVINLCNDARQNALNELDKIHLFVSPGNDKIGSTIDISLLPVVDCTNCSTCIRACYAIRSLFRLGYNANTNICARKWGANSALARYDLERFFNELTAYFTLNDVKFCRIHVSGDFFSPEYFTKWVEFIKDHPDCEFQAFTKSFSIVNDYCSLYGVESFPSNFHLMFSGWYGLDISKNNPYMFPVFSPYKKGDPKTNGIPTGWKVAFCPGSCEVCKNAKCGCYGAKFGTGVIVEEH